MRPDPIPDPFAFLADGPITATFRTQVASRRQTPYTWRPGLDLTIGYSWPPSSPAPVPIIFLANEDCSQDSALLMAPGDRLVAQIDLRAVVDIICPNAPAMYLKAECTIEPAGQRFSGTVAATCTDRSGPQPYGWTGSAATSAGQLQQIAALTAWCREYGHG